MTKVAACSGKYSKLKFKHRLPLRGGRDFGKLDLHLILRMTQIVSCPLEFRTLVHHDLSLYYELVRCGNQPLATKGSLIAIVAVINSTWWPNVSLLFAKTKKSSIWFWVSVIISSRDPAFLFWTPLLTPNCRMEPVVYYSTSMWCQVIRDG